MTKKPSCRKRGAASHCLGCIVLAAAALVAGCGDKKEKSASQTAVKVNKSEITVHQINFVLQQQRGLRQEQLEAASKQVLERLIDQQLAVEKADELKLDRDPRVVQQLEASRREIIARAYAERIGDAVPKPTAEEIRKYYDEKPALFKDRRIYSFQELNIEAKPEQREEIRAKLASSKNVAEFIEYMKVRDIRFAGNQAVRAAEQLPLQSLDTFAKLKDGQMIVNSSPGGLQVVVLAGSRLQPVSEEQARGAIDAFLTNERKRKLVEDDIRQLRAAAKIEYIGKFAESAASKPQSEAKPGGAQPGPAPASQPATTGLSNSDISKGLGIKK